jgi:hypothetical protein
VGPGATEAEDLIDENGGINVNPYTGVGTSFSLPGGGEISFVLVVVLSLVLVLKVRLLLLIQDLLVL